MFHLLSSQSVARLGRATFATISGVLAVNSAHGQTLPPAEPPTPLAPYVVAATRTPVPVFTLGSAVSAIDPADLARRQQTSLAAALGLAVGVPTAASGAPGSTTSLFLRGANSNQTLFLVDGIRLNDPNTDYQLFLGGACVASCDSLEIAHGPQSTLYGGEAVGGVVALRAQRGTGPREGSLGFEAGRFGTVQGALSVRGGEGEWGYAFAAVGGHTDNDRPNNAFTSGNATLRLDRDLRPGLTAGGTLRHFQGVYGSPGSRFTNDPDNEEREANTLGTLFVEWTPGGDWSGRATVGGQARRFVSENPAPNRPTQVTVVTNRRAVLDAQASYTGWAGHRATAGFTTEANHTRNTGFGDINERQTLLALFVQDEWSPAESLHFTAGLRSDDHDTFGRATTGRVTVAWLPAPGRVKLRASHGTAFRAPSFLDLYGTSAFYQGNPDLRPERARGTDAGIDVYLPNGYGTLSATGFDTRLRDLIVFDFGVFPGTTANVERARTRGLEVAARLGDAAAAQLQLAYTFLEAENLTQGTRLLRRPRHSLEADLWREFGRGIGAGLGLRWVAQREDVAANTFARIDGEDYTVVRLYASWRATARLTVTARIENLLDERYEEVHGYPALPRGAFAGVQWRF
jgi:vitamin B12 transporter